MKTNVKIAGLLMAVMALSVPVVYADSGGGDKDSWHQDGGRHHGRMFAKILGLSDDQVKQMKDNSDKQKEAMKGIFVQIKANREAFNAEITKAAPDMNKINDLQTQIKALQSQMVDNHLNSILELKKIMTPEQFAGYMALKKERMMMKKMMGHNKFGHEGWSGKDGDKGGMDHGSDSQD